MTKSQAFVKHFLLSAFIVAIALTVIFKVWYPYPYFSIAGAHRVLQILIGVDLILGPLLTLVLYKPGKKWLWFDMSFVAAVQVAALIYGLTTIYGQRPYYAAYVVDRYVLMTATDIDASEIPPQFAATRPRAGPLYVVAKLPVDPETREKLMFELVGGAPDIQYRPDLWHIYENESDYLREKLKPLKSLSGLDPAIDQFIKDKASGEAGELLYAPIQGTAGAYMTLVVAAESLEPLDVIDVDLFEIEAVRSSGD